MWLERVPDRPGRRGARHPFPPPPIAGSLLLTDSIRAVGSTDGHCFTGTFRAGAATFVVECPSDRVRDAVEALLVDLAEHPSTDDPFVVSLDADPTSDWVTIRGGEQVREPQPPESVLASLVTVVSRLALDAEPERLHLHCAALALHGRGVLISAPSGIGKSTLAAGMVLRGWTYVSDEAVGIESRSTTATGFAKPIVIKADGNDLLPELDAARVSLAHDDHEWCVPASALDAAIAPETEPAVVVALQRSADGDTQAPPTASPLHAADAVVTLMGQTMDAERFGPDAVTVVAHLAARSRCVRLSVGPLDAAVSLLAEAVASPHDPLDVHVFPPHGSQPDDVSPGWSVPAQVRSVMIGDRAVVHDTVGGSIVALDEAGTAVWQALHGEAPHWWQPDALQQADIVHFLGQLAGYGLVAGDVTTQPAS